MKLAPLSLAPLALAIALLGALIALAAGAPLGAWFAKEGPSEHLAHAILVAIVVLFAIAATRRRWVALVASYFAFVLGEELDWGGVYTGESGGNLHNAWGGASYVLFALPVLAYFVLALVPRARRTLERALGPATPTAIESSAAIAIALTGAAGALLVPAHEPAMDEATELALYLLFALIGARAAIGPRTRTGTGGGTGDGTGTGGGTGDGTGTGLGTGTGTGTGTGLGTGDGTGTGTGTGTGRALLSA